MIHLFLSASVPLPDRDPRYFRTADVIAIRDSVKALISTALASSVIVFGGHPAITPLIALLMRGMPDETRHRLVLFQSRYFEQSFLEENDEFLDVRLTPALGDRQESLRRMRHDMIRFKKFDAAIFIGGMEGIWAEFHEFRSAHPYASCYPIASTGGAAFELYQEIGRDRQDLIRELTYPTLFRNLLNEINQRMRR